jgi:hypothetical protein
MLSRLLWAPDPGQRGVAQLGSALRSGRRGRGFKSRHPDQCFWAPRPCRPAHRRRRQQQKYSTSDERRSRSTTGDRCLRAAMSQRCCSCPLRACLRSFWFPRTRAVQSAKAANHDMVNRLNSANNWKSAPQDDYWTTMGSTGRPRAEHQWHMPHDYDVRAEAQNSCEPAPA